MIDILERLRRPANQFLFQPETSEIAWSLVKEAADEIESLRARTLKWEAQAKRWKNVALTEENNDC